MKQNVYFLCMRLKGYKETHSMNTMDTKKEEYLDVPLGTRSTRRKENANFNEFVIKSGLSSAIALEPNVKKLFLDDIGCRVEAVSKGVHRLSLAIILLVKESLSAHRDKRQCTIYDFDDSTFALQVMLGSGRKDFDKVKTFLNKYDSLLPPSPVRYPGDSNSYVRATEGYLTNYKTFLSTEFEKRHERYCKIWCRKNGFPENESYMLAKRISGSRITVSIPLWLNSDIVKQ